MCNYPKYFEKIYQFGTKKLYPIPCHQCLGCKIDRRKMWEMRITSEYIKYRNAFITLTYDEYHVPYNLGSQLPTVKHEDFHKFIDRLRHYTNNLKEMPELCTKNWKYVGVAEYGNLGRPHYHAILLGLDFLTFKKIIHEKWGMGITDCKPVLKGGIRYVLKYMDTAKSGAYADNEFFDTGRERPKMYFSRGIGKDWIISQIENINKYGMAKIGQRLVPIPSYWKNKLFSYCDENIYKQREHQNQYVKDMNQQARALGFDSYENFIREQRKAIETNLEKRNLKEHQPITRLAEEINGKKLPWYSNLLLDYSKK